MSKKSPKIAQLISASVGHPIHSPYYLGYFQCFNAQDFYDAHDVLEELWLADKYGPDGLFYKGLIQFAGAFVHLQKGRLGPSAKLFQLALNNLTQYPNLHQDLDVSKVCAMARDYLQDLVASNYLRNPLPARPPHLALAPPARA